MQGFVCKRLWGKTVVTLNMFFIRNNFPIRNARKCSAAQGPHSEVVPRAFSRLVSKSCDECKGSFARGCEAKRWSHWTCSSLGTIFPLGTIFQPMRINSLPDVKCFCNNKIIKRCYVHNQWYYISCATLYINGTSSKSILISTYPRLVLTSGLITTDFETKISKSFSLFPGAFPAFSVPFSSIWPSK